MTERRVRVRFAPSPTGPLHIGGVRTALYNYVFAKKHGGDFLLRIEDTDQERFVPGAEEYIIESLKWAGMDYDEGPGKGGPHAPYRQSERMHLYKQYADELLAKGHAYYAFDTPEELDAMRERMAKAGSNAWKYDHVTREYMKNSLTLSQDEVKHRLEDGDPYVIRVKIPRNEEIRLQDIIRGWVVVQSNQLDDKVLFKSDGMPTYHMANVADDHLMEITHVIRGEEWLPSAPLHVLLYKYLGWEDTMPQFAHLPLILRPDGNGKLSKRDGDRLGIPVYALNYTDPETAETSKGYRESGYLPEAVLNIIAFLGWHPSDNKELFSMDELIESFSLERVSKSGARFDVEKAKWFNHQYLKTKDNHSLASEFRKVLEEKNLNPTEEYLENVCGLIKEKAGFINDFWSLGHFFFIRPDKYDETVIQKKWDDNAPVFFEKLKEAYNQTADFSILNLQKVYEDTANGLGLKPGNYMQLLRVMITGESHGPALWDTLALLGKEEVLARIEKILNDKK